MLSIIIHLLFTIASAAVLSDRQTLSGSDVCQQISGNITGEVYFPLSLELNFKKDIEHYMSSSVCFDPLINSCQKNFLLSSSH